VNPTEANNIKNLILSSVFVLIASSAAQAQQAVQWKVSDGGNGHWYECSDVASPWSIAKTAAEAMGGHLATINSSSENAFVHGIATVSGAGTWLGAIAPTGQCVSADAYGWVTGEPFDFTAWAPTEPNGGFGSADCGLAYWYEASLGPRWNDVPQTWSCRYLTEWSADCNNDGIVDYGQILDGTFPDANGNGVPDCCDGVGSCTPCPGDVASDGMVDGVDLAAVLSQWGTQGSGTFNADIDNSGLVDGGDLGIVLGGWGPCPQ